MISGSWRSAIFEGVLLGMLIVPALFLYFPLGFRFSLVNFTYGDKGLNPDSRQWLPVYFAIIFFATWFWEIVFRRGLLVVLIKRLSGARALLFHMALAALIAVLLGLAVGFRPGGLGYFRFALLEFILQGIWGVLYLRIGRVGITAFFHAVYNLGRFVFMNDVQSSLDTFYFFSSASDDFYWLEIAAPFFVFSVLMAWGRRMKLRAIPPEGGAS